VRQGQISELISAKPQNRRRILEDAAGIAGLHARRHEADLKLRAAETNLTRLDEVLAEIEGQAASLKKQARQAERYRGLAQTLRETEALLLHRRWKEARERAAEAQTHLREAERAVAQAAADASAAERKANDARDALGPLREEEAIAAAVLRRFEGVRVGLERDLAEAEAAIERCDVDAQRALAESERLQALKQDAEAALQRLAEESEALGAGDGAQAQAQLKAAHDAEAKAAQAREQAEAQLEALSVQAAAHKARAQALTDTATAARARLQRVEQSKRSLEAQIASLPNTAMLDADLAKAQDKASTLEAQASATREALADTEAKLKRAGEQQDTVWAPYRAAQAALDTLTAEVRAIERLAPAQATKFPPVLASIDVEPGYERALAAALGDDIEASTEAQAPTRWAGAALPASQLPPSVQSLARVVKAPDALAARLALIGIVDAQDGAALAAQLPPGARLVSREGDLWRWDGFVRRADAPQPAAARLEHKNRLVAARKELKAAEKALTDAKAAWENAKHERDALDTQARALRLDAAKLTQSAHESARAAERLQADRARIAEREVVLSAQAKALAAELEDAKSAVSGIAAPGDNVTLVDEPALEAARAAVRDTRQAAAEASAAVQALVRDKAQREARRVALAAESVNWRARVADANARLSALSKELDEIERRRDAAKALPQLARGKLETLMDEAGAAEARRAAASDKVAEGEAAARLAAEAARAAEQVHASARERRAAAEAHADSASERVGQIEVAAREQTSSAPEDLASLAGNLISGALGTAPLAEVERRLERLKAEREAAGPVNLRAHEELAEIEERIAVLTNEKEDVAQGVAKLRRAITTLNNEGRTRLMRAFEEVDAHFAQLFATLFEGGQANLKLTESDDPLEAGLEIFAEPPGKRLSHLSLLSGGEQALTATALIFAVFLANPAPLCVLDEVDAPLDDANVDRFCRMLEEMKRLTTTRFIVITHNPVTMSRMDRLYGVTMPEQGVSQLVSVDLGRAQAMAAE
jgi:chromosome segregation protein